MSGLGITALFEGEKKELQVKYASQFELLQSEIALWNWRIFSLYYFCIIRMVIVGSGDECRSIPA